MDAKGKLSTKSNEWEVLVQNIWTRGIRDLKVIKLGYSNQKECKLSAQGKREDYIMEVGKIVDYSVEDKGVIYVSIVYDCDPDTEVEEIVYDPTRQFPSTLLKVVPGPENNTPAPKRKKPKYLIVHKHRLLP
jgi:hypothetical protein